MRHTRVTRTIARSDALIKESKSLKAASVKLVACSQDLREGSKKLIEQVQHTCSSGLAKLPSGRTTSESGNGSMVDRPVSLPPVAEPAAAEIQ